MNIETILILTLVMLLAWANGSNDIAKGIATLVGSGASSDRRAVVWGTLWTILGGLAAIVWGAALIKTFSSAYTSSSFDIDSRFIASTLAGASIWVLLATRYGLPVSTTHALLGGVVGAALVAAGPTGLQAHAVANKAILPLLAAPLLAIAICAALLLVARYVARKVPAWSPGCCDKKEWEKNPFNCASGDDNSVPSQRIKSLWIALHWLSGGITSFARGLNDVPKIAAFLILALSLNPEFSSGLNSGAGFTYNNFVWSILLVTFVMGLGSFFGGFKVLRLMSHRVTPLDASSGLVANMGTSALVLAASPLGLPVSTTHVSTGALMGIRWTNRVIPQKADALKLILYGWIITLPVAALVAATSAGLISYL